MDTREQFNQRIDQTWAEQFNVPVETVSMPGTTILPVEKYARKGILALWKIGKHVFVEADPAYAPQLTDLLARLPAETRLSAGLVAQSWQSATLSAESSDEMVFYLYAPDLPDYRPAPPYTLRQITLADAAAMEALHAACPSEDVDEGFVEVTHEVAFGAFHGETLAAASSGYTRTGFMDIGVLTHPAHRRHGLARAVAGALADWSFRNGYVPQYRCSSQNTASRRVAESLNFRLYSESEAVWLKPVYITPDR